MKEEKIRHEWAETGTLDVTIHGPHCASVHFTPSETAASAGLERSERVRKANEHIREFNRKMCELKSRGYYSGGWDRETDKTAICKDGKIVGYMDRELNIEWR